jgi:hypothetical protein
MPHLNFPAGHVKFLQYPLRNRRHNRPVSNFAR